MLSDDDVRLLARLHGDLPLTDRPFADVAAELGHTEDWVIERLRQMLAQGLLTRFGPLYQIEQAGGLFVLAALEAPEERFDEIAAQVNALPEVAHNYRRDHRLNMWFEIAAETPDKAFQARQHIQQVTGLPVFAFPKEREYFVELRLPLQAGDQPTLAEHHDAA